MTSVYQASATSSAKRSLGDRGSNTRALNTPASDGLLIQSQAPYRLATPQRPSTTIAVLVPEF
jgi:hypothetical protein